MYENLITEMDYAGFAVTIKGNKLILSNSDGILGGFGLRGWQWEKFRNVLTNNNLDYYIESLNCDNLVIVLITLEESLKY